MPWECPDCHKQIADGEFECIACGYIKKLRLILTSSCGKTFSTIISFKIGRSVYKQLGGNDYEYLSPIPGAYQFQIVYRQDFDFHWGIETSAESSLNTVLNDVVCEIGVVYPIKAGDVIKIGSKKNLSNTIAPLIVSFG